MSSSSSSSDATPTTDVTITASLYSDTTMHPQPVPVPTPHPEPATANASYSSSQPHPTSTPILPSTQAHGRLCLSEQEQLRQLWDDIASVEPPKRVNLLSQMSAAQVDDALRHLQLFLAALAPVNVSATSAPSDPAVRKSLTAVVSSTQPHFLDGKTQPQAGELPKPTADNGRWGETVILPYEQYKASHSDSSHLQTFPFWCCASIWRPPSDRTVNTFQLHGPVGFVKRLTQPLSKGWGQVEGAKPTSWWNAMWTWVGVFAALACVSILHQYYTNARYDWPMLFASHGALVTILFCTPGNSAVQPYHIFMGTLIGTFYPVLIAHHMNTTQQLWLAVALSSSATITTMQLLGCNHPPAGALSVLYLAVPTVQVLGYWYIIAGEMGAFICFLVALIVNNIPKIEGRQYPASWFS